MAQCSICHESESEMPAFSGMHKYGPLDHDFVPELTPYDRAIAYAAERGRDDGTNAAGWYIQDTFGGRVTRGNEDAAARILKGDEIARAARETVTVSE